MSTLGYIAEQLTPDAIAQLKALDPDFDKPRDMDKQYEELKALCEPVNDWLQRNYPPHTKILIMQGYAELLDGGIGVSYELLDQPIEEAANKPLEQPPNRTCETCKYFHREFSERDDTCTRMGFEPTKPTSYCTAYKPRGALCN